MGSIANNNSEKNPHNTVNNNASKEWTSEYRSENSQNQPHSNMQQYANTTPYTMQLQNQSKFSENSRRLLVQPNSMEPKSQRPQKNSGVRRNIMSNRNNTQNWEPQDVCLWETLRNPQHTHDTWWSTNQPDTTSYLQLPPRKFQEKRRQMVNYDEEEDLSWCNKCGKLGHIHAFGMARVYCHYCRMRSHNSKACWNQQRHERIEPFSSSRQTSPIQNAVQQGQIQNYGEQRNKQTVTTAT